LRVPHEQVAGLISAYRRARPLDTQGDIYIQIFGDHRYHRSVTRAAELQISHDGAPVYMYLLKWKSPALNGILRTPHTLCLAFAFGNIDRATGITGTGAERYPLQEEMAGAWLAFASSGNPNHRGLTTWHPYARTARATMVFDTETHLVNDPLQEERVAFESYPRYEPAIGEAEGNW